MSAKIITYGAQISAGSTAIPDNNATALDIESTDGKDYIVVDTTDGQETMKIGSGSGTSDVCKVSVGSNPGTVGEVFRVRQSYTADSLALIENTGAGSALDVSSGTNSASVDVMTVKNGTGTIAAFGADGETTLTGRALIKGDVSDELTGTVSIDSGALNTLIGSGTAFETELFDGAAVKIDGQTFHILSIASNTSAVLDSNASGAVSAGTKIYTDNSPIFQVQSGDSRSMVEVNNHFMRISGRGGPSATAPSTDDVCLYIDGNNSPTGHTYSTAVQINSQGPSGPQILMGSDGSTTGKLFTQSSVLYVGTNSTNQDVVLFPGSQKIMSVRGDDRCAVLQDSDIKLYQNEASAAGQEICFYKSRNTTDENATTAVNDNDILGEIKWKGADGNSFATGARVFARVRGTPGDGDMPCELVFAMSKDGSEAPVETLRIMPTATANKAQVTIGTDSYASAYTYSPIAVDAETQNGPVFERTGNGNAMVFQFNTKNCIAGSNHPISLMPGGTERLLVGTDGTVTATSGLLSSVGAVATALTDSGGTASVSTSGSSTTLTGVNTAFSTDFHVGAAIKVGTVTTTVTAIASDTSLTLEDAINTSSTGTTCTRDGGELFAVKTGDSKTIFSVNGNGAVGLGTATGSLTSSNLSIGDANAFDNTTREAFKNTFVGQTENAHALTGGHSNTLFGFAAGEDLANGDRNTTVGCESGGFTNSTDATYVGYRAGQACTGSHNAVVGASALDASGSAAESVAVGSSALTAATGSWNVGVGYTAGDSIVGGQGNVMLGHGTDNGASSNYGVAIGISSVCNGHRENLIGASISSYGANTTSIGNDEQNFIVNEGVGTCSIGALDRPFGGLMTMARKILSIERSLGQVNTTDTGKIDQLLAFGSVSAVKIPAYSIITFCSLTMTDASGASTHNAMVATSTTSGTSDGTALAGTVVEIIGAGAAGTRSTDTTGSATDIDLKAAPGKTWYNDSKFHVGSSDVYLYVATAGTSNSGSAGTCKAILTVEYIGVD